MWTETTRAQYRRDELSYASDTREAEWAQIAPLVPPPRRLGRVQGYFYRWRDEGTWAPDRCGAGGAGAPARRAQRRALGRDYRQPKRTDPKAYRPQSVPTTESGGPRGIDDGKRIKRGKRSKGGKRHILTDTEGFVLAVRVHEANIQDSHGAVPLLRAARRSRLSRRTIAQCRCRLRPVDDRNRRAPAMGGRAHPRLARPFAPSGQRFRGDHPQRHRMGLARALAPPLPPPGKSLI